MKTARVIGLTLICLAMGMSQALAQYGDPQYVRRVGGNAWVASVDQPENCLRIRNGPGINFEIIGCARFGDQLVLSGLWTQDNWAEVVEPVKGWVAGSQIRLTPVYASSAPVTVVRDYSPPDVTYINYFPRRYYSGYYWPGRYWPRYWGNFWWRHHRHHGHHPFAYKGGHVKSANWGGSHIKSGNWRGSHVRSGAWGGGSHMKAAAWSGSNMRSGGWAGSRGMGVRAGHAGFGGGHAGGRGRGR